MIIGKTAIHLHLVHNSQLPPVKSGNWRCINPNAACEPPFCALAAARHRATLLVFVLHYVKPLLEHFSHPIYSGLRGILTTRTGQECQDHRILGSKQPLDPALSFSAFLLTPGTDRCNRLLNKLGRNLTIAVQKAAWLGYLGVSWSTLTSRTRCVELQIIVAVLVKIAHDGKTIVVGDLPAMRRDHIMRPPNFLYTI